MGRHQSGSTPPPPGQGGGYGFEVVTLGPPKYLSTPLIPADKGGLTPVTPGEAAPSVLPDNTALAFEARFQLGRVRLAQNDDASAAAAFEQAIALVRRIRDPQRADMALRSIQATIADAGRRSEPTADHQQFLARVLVAYGSLLHDLGRVTDASVALEQALIVLSRVESLEDASLEQS